MKKLENFVKATNNTKLLKNGWKILKFSDCIKQLNTGLNPRNNFTLGTGTLKYITAKNLTKYGTIDFFKCDLIDEKAKKIIHKRSDIKIDDILFSSRAPIGQTHLIKESPDFYDIGESIFSIRVNKEIVHPEYLSLYLTSDYFIESASKHTTGSIILEIRISDLMNTEIIVPEKNIQEKIVNILQPIDQKIQNNKKIIAELEEMAKTVYMHMFFRKEHNGKLSDIINENAKSSIQVGDVKGVDGIFPFYTSGEAIYTWKEFLVNGRNCFLNTGGNADVKYYVGESAYSTDTWCINGENSLTDYLYLLLRTIKVELNSKYFQGTGLKHLQKDLLKQSPIYIPNENELKEFNRIVVPTFNMVSEKIRENTELTSLRDWLLPMLMNGQAVVE